MPKRIMTLVHISDLHIGELNPSSGDALITRRLENAISNASTPLDGLLGHHSSALRQLSTFWNGIKREEPDAELVVSGDVTRCGNHVELQNAEKYLGSVIKMPWGTTGLECSSWMDYAVPGNHDHWPGTGKIFGPPDPGVSRAFLQGRYSWIRQLTSEIPQVVLVGINTDADVKPFSRDRFTAVGRFQSQLAEASQQLLTVDENCIRVLVMHHSWHKRGMLGISKSSRDALNQFLDDSHIQLILSGHVHTPLVEKFTIAKDGQHIYECRCGTTTQIDKMNLNSQSIWGGFPARPNWPANTLLVHRLFQSDHGRLDWQVKTYKRMRSAFRPVPLLTKEIPL